MLELLLVAPLFALLPSPQAQPPRPTERPTSELQVHAIRYLGNADLREALVRSDEVWHDTGNVLVGRFRERTIRTLAARGIGSLELGAAGTTDELWLVRESEAVRLHGTLPDSARELARFDGLRLLALAPGERPVPRDATVRPPDHFSVTRILKHPWRPSRPFTWRGREDAAGALAAAAPDPRIQALVDQVDPANLAATVAALAALHTRRADQPEADVARDMVLGWFQDAGLTPYLEPFDPQYSENVVAELPGTTRADEIVVIGAHYDSYNGDGPASPAPGADDNATGTAGLLEAARILATGGPFERTIRFVAFGAEEFGLIGSSASAQASASAGEDVVAMLNTDMSAYRAPGDARDCDFVTSNASTALIAFCDVAGAMYVPGWASTTGALSGGSSDHAAYTAAGFPAVFYFEDVTSYSPYIHSDLDTVALSTNDYALSEMIVKGIVAAAAAKAEPLDMQIVHAPLGNTPGTLRRPHRVRAQVASLIGTGVVGMDLDYSLDGQSWTTVPMTDLGGGTFEGFVPFVPTPVTLHYHVTARDDQGYTETAPEGADLGGAPYSFFVGIERVFHTARFEGPGDEGWTHGQLATQDDWQRGIPQGKAGDPAGPWEGTGAWANDLGASGWNGAYASDTWNWLRSPSIDCSRAGSVLLQFRRWLTVEEGIYDQAQILVNGTLVWENPASGNTIDTQWTLFQLDVSPQAAGNPDVTVEFRLRSDSSLEFGGWNIDDFQLVERLATPARATAPVPRQ